MVRRNIIANFIGRAWVAVMSIAFVPIYVRLLGIETYGLVGFYATLQVTFSLLDLGLSTTINRHLASLVATRAPAHELRSTVRSFEALYWIIGLVIAVAILAGAAPIAQHWVRSEHLPTYTIRNGIMWMGFIAFFQWPVSLYTGGMLGLQRQVQVNIVNAVSATIRGVGTIAVLWYTEPTIGRFFAWQGLSYGIQTLWLALWLWRSLPPMVDGQRTRFSWALLKIVRRFAIEMSFISVLTVLLSQTDKFVLSRMLTLTAFGYYTLATVVASGLYYVVLPIYEAVFPRFSTLIALKDDVALVTLYHKACQVLSVFLLSAALIIVFYTKEIMLAWTGDPTTVNNTYTVLRLLAIGTAVNGLMNIPYALQLASGWTRLTIWINIVSVVVLVPAIILLAQRFGGAGAATCWVLLNAGYLFVAIPIMHTRLLRNEMKTWYLTDIGQPLLFAGLTVLVFRFVLPVPAHRIGLLAFLLGISIITVTAATLGSPALRALLRQANFVKAWAQV